MNRVVFIVSIILMMVGTSQVDAMIKSDTTKVKKIGLWSTTSNPAFKIDQKYYDNWSATGNSLISFTTTFYGNYKYTKNNFIWDNIVNMAFGYSWQDLIKDTTSRGFDIYDSRRKSDDKIDLTSTVSMRLDQSWNVNTLVNFKTQFGLGFNYPTANDDEKILVSKFLAPAYLTTAVGFERKEKDWNFSLSFLSGKTTFVVDDSLIAAGYGYGVIQDSNDMAKGIYNHSYFGLGSYVKFFYKKDVTKHLNIYTRLELFYDYRKPSLMDWEHMNPDNKDYRETFWGRRAFETDVDCEMTLTYKFNSWLSMYFSLNMKYDTDYSGKDGMLDRWQLYQNAGIQVYFNWKRDQKPPQEKGK